MRTFVATTVLAVALASSVTASSGSWDQDVGTAAPALVPAGWVGTPLTLDAVRGNVVVLAFWNADIPC
jgi:hypothetical protein